MTELRIGIGVDAHAFEEGVPLVLGGVRFDYPRGLAGHSDGDVVAHALIDALLGAADLGDIGSLFPSDDERYRGASSLDLLWEAYREVREAGWRARERRLRARSARSRGSRRARRDVRAAGGGARRRRRPREVRATTTDGLGFTGRGEGLAAQAVALLERP